ncbi:hypothetical protein [Myroides pelagicus]|uniref:Uncharacterized protein n=1 Tax=Myroides pelagicus TaxID=270914 RepID=A0A7K1GQA1_9FLAO|nr:hypothetical protein [Myroides pelagicus]MTH31031.1 hypothetical protein [Myroides pelagicus]
MKKFIKNLLAPLALIAMLAVGAFSVNASEVKTNVKLAVFEQPQNPYSGEIFIRVLEPGTSNYIYSKVGEIDEGECTLEVTAQRCSTIVEGMNHYLWGKDAFGNYAELYQDENL